MKKVMKYSMMSLLIVSLIFFNIMPVYASVIKDDIYTTEAEENKDKEDETKEDKLSEQEEDKNLSQEDVETKDTEVKMEGDGTEDKPYLVKNDDDINEMVSLLANSKQEYFKLETDIDEDIWYSAKVEHGKIITLKDGYEEDIRIWNAVSTNDVIDGNGKKAYLKGDRSLIEQIKDGGQLKNLDIEINEKDITPIVYELIGDSRSKSIIKNINVNVLGHKDSNGVIELMGSILVNNLAEGGEIEGIYVEYINEAKDIKGHPQIGSNKNDPPNRSDRYRSDVVGNFFGGNISGVIVKGFPTLGSLVGRQHRPGDISNIVIDGSDTLDGYTTMWGILLGTKRYNATTGGEIDRILLRNIKSHTIFTRNGDQIDDFRLHDLQLENVHLSVGVAFGGRERVGPSMSVGSMIDSYSVGLGEYKSSQLMPVENLNVSNFITNSFYTNQATIPERNNMIRTFGELNEIETFNEFGGGWDIDDNLYSDAVWYQKGHMLPQLKGLPGEYDLVYRENIKEDFEINEKNIQLQVDETKQLTVSAPKDADVTWEIEKKDIVSVDGKGLIKGLAKGKTDVIASITVGGEILSSVRTITVGDEPAEEKDIEIINDKIKIKVGDFETLKTNMPEGTKLEWKSSDENIASVDDSGKVEGKSIGEVSIEVKVKGTDNKTTGIVEVYDDPAEAKDIEIIGGDTRLKLGSSKKLRTNLDSEADLTWESEDDSIVSVDKSGQIKGVALGSTKIKVTVSDKGKEYSAKINVEVYSDDGEDPEIESEIKHIVVSEDKVYLKVGESHPINYRIVPTDAKNKNVEWFSNSDSVTIEKNKNIKANKPGFAIIKGVSDNGIMTTMFVEIIGRDGSIGGPSDGGSNITNNYYDNSSNYDKDLIDKLQELGLIENKFDKNIPYTVLKDSQINWNILLDMPKSAMTAKLDTSKVGVQKLKLEFKDRDIKNLEYDIEVIDLIKNKSSLDNIDHWAEDAVIDVVNKGYIRGFDNGDLDLEGKLTYADSFTAFNRLLLSNGIVANNLTRKEIDSRTLAINNRKWYAYSMRSVYGKYKDKDDINVSLRTPNKEIKREEIAEMLYKTLEDVVDKSKVSKDYQDIKNMKDIKDIEKYDVWKFVNKMGLMIGDDNSKLNPKKGLTRAEFMTILNRLDDLLK